MVSVSNGEVHAGPAAVPVIPLILMGTGVYLCWFAVHYWGSDVKWPTDPVKAVLTGKPLPDATGQQSAQQIAGAVEGQQLYSGQIGPAGTPPGQKGAYDIAALEKLWISQGGSPARAFEAANIAMAESSGRPDATSNNPDGGINVGLWQLDTLGKGSGYTIEELKDPATNARVTVFASVNGTNWSAWADAVVHNGVYTGPSV